MLNKGVGLLSMLGLEFQHANTKLVPMLVGKVIPGIVCRFMKISIDRTKQSNKQKVFKKLTKLPKMVMIDGNVCMMSIGVKVLIIF